MIQQETLFSRSSSIVRSMGVEYWKHPPKIPCFMSEMIKKKFLVPTQVKISTITHGIILLG